MAVVSRVDLETASGEASCVDSVLCHLFFCFFFYPQPSMINLNVDNDVQLVRSKLLCSVSEDYS